MVHPWGFVKLQWDPNGTPLGFCEMAMDPNGILTGGMVEHVAGAVSGETVRQVVVAATGGLVGCVASTEVTISITVR